MKTDNCESYLSVKIDDRTETKTEKCECKRGEIFFSIGICVPIIRDGKLVCPKEKQDE